MCNLKTRSVGTARLLWITSLGLTLTAVPALAQQNLPAPVGWRKVIRGSDTIFLSQRTAGTYTVKGLMPRATSFPSWFNAQVALDSSRRGILVGSKVLPPNGGVYCVARNFRSSDGARQSLFYVGYAVGNSGRLTFFTAPTERILSQHVRDLKRLGSQVAAHDQQLRQGSNASPRTQRAAKSPSLRRNDPRDIAIAKPPHL